MKKVSLGIVSFSAVTLLAASAYAADLPKLHVTGIGVNGPTVASIEDEVPFWTKVIPKASGGQITVNFAPMDQMGVKGDQVMRMTKLGVVDFGASDVSKMAGDDPIFEGCDLAGLTLTLDKARAACEAWLPVMNEAAGRLFNIKMLALGVNPPQVIWCRVPIKGLADLKGKKVRVFNTTMTDFVQAVGASAVNLPFAEVVPALQRGVVDCAVTGNLSGNTAGWTEVTTHQFQIIMGWSVNYQAVNLDAWKRFGEPTRKFFTEQFAKLEDKMWETGRKASEDADGCNFGTAVCKMGKAAKKPLVNVPVPAADMKLHAKLMQEVVLVNWGKRAGKANAQKWNDTVGKVLGMTIPLDKL